MSDVPVPVVPQTAAVSPSVVLPPLSAQEKEELRQRVLRGERLDVQTSKRIASSLRGERMTAAANAVANKAKRTRKKGMTDAELDADLDKFLGLGGTSAGGSPGDSGSEGAGSSDLAPDLDIS